MPKTPTPIRELGCYVDVNGSFYEVPRLDVEQNFRWEIMAQLVDVTTPTGKGGLTGWWWM